MRWSSHTIRQEKLDRQAAVIGSVNLSGIPLTRVAPRYRKLGTATGKGRVEGTDSHFGESTLKPIRMPEAALPPDGSVRMGRINPDGTRTMDTETTQQIADRRKAEIANREQYLINHKRYIEAITADAGILDLPDTWGNRQDS